MFELRHLALIAGAIIGSAFAGVTAEAGSPAYNWTGLYVGATASMSGGEFSQVFSDYGVSYNTDRAFASGFSGGGEIGVNFQPANSGLVAGVEADIQASSLKGTYADFGPAFNSGTAIDWWGTVRGRVGYAVGRVLPYVTGGVAYGHLTNSYVDIYNGVLPYDESWSSTRWGWALGAGVEAAVTQNLSVKAEYLYTNFSWDSVDPQDAAAFGDEYHNKVSAGFSTARIGLNWKFN